MIPLATREQVRAIDADAIGRLGIPGLVLMENAGAFATQALMQHFPEHLSRVLIVGGVGQNGGDAWVVARKLLTLGHVPRCVLVGARERVQGDARVNFEALLKLGLSIESVTDAAGLISLGAALDGCSLVVDGLFGTGLDRGIEGLYANAIVRLNQSRAPKVALDLPSGIDANTGQVLGVAVEAQLTVTFAAHKRGLHQFPGARYAGKLVLVDIGVPVAPPSDAYALSASDLNAYLTPRALDSHKGTHGHALILAGSEGKTGAALLSALGALRAGAGLVSIATSEAARRALDHKVIEVMTDVVPAGPQAVPTALRLAHGKASALLGPGLGLDDAQRNYARSLAVSLPIPCVLDADALSAIGTDLSLLRDAQAPRILTPHPAEAARLLGTTTQAVQADRYAAALELAHRSAQVAVLKGARTVIASPEGSLRVCTAGTPALGVAGTGDVLAGVITALAGQLSPFDAACSGVLLHALAAERAAQGDRGLLASEVAAAIPGAMQACFQASM